MDDAGENDTIVVVCEFCGGEFEWSRDLGEWAECPDCSELTYVDVGNDDAGRPREGTQ